jgi:hypothetical protein
MAQLPRKTPLCDDGDGRLSRGLDDYVRAICDTDRKVPVSSMVCAWDIQR